MKKCDVKTHNSGGCGGPYYPALNVKIYTPPVTSETVAQRFGCSEGVAERALQWQHESAREMFWGDVQEWVVEVFGKGAQRFSAGRSGGWLIVEGLGAVEDWDAIALSRWCRFAAGVARDIAGRLDADCILEDIEANRWAEENAEQYNYCDTKEGETVCLADIPRCAHCGG